MNKIHLQTSFLILLILVVALSRFFSPLLNFSPLAAIGLFGAAHFYKKWQAFVVPLAAVLVSDLVLNNTLYLAFHGKFTLFYMGFFWQYVAYFLIIIIGLLFFKKSISFVKILGGVGLSTLAFFLISNFGAWASFGMYPKTFSGLTACYIAGLPFLKGSIFGNIFYSFVLFGGYYLLQRNFSFFRLSYQKYI